VLVGSCANYPFPAADEQTSRQTVSQSRNPVFLQGTLGRRWLAGGLKSEDLGGEICLRKLFNLSGPSFVAPNAPPHPQRPWFLHLIVGLDQQKMLTPPGPISSPMMMRTMP
jgi:hypothetical protein